MPHKPQCCCGEAHAHTQHKTQHKPQCTEVLWWTTARPKVGSRVPAHVTAQPTVFTRVLPLALADSATHARVRRRAGGWGVARSFAGSVTGWKENSHKFYSRVPSDPEPDRHPAQPVPYTGVYD
eukprot:1973323-Rhodomonas_salina.1